MQSLLEPTTVELTHSQAELLRENCESLTRYGFSFEEFGERTYLLRSVPPSLSTSEPVQALREVLDLMAADFRLMEREEAIAASIACHGAVRAGKSLSQQEMSELVRQLEETRTPNTCPHGRPTMIRLSANQLEREFKRR
jgi:DNA mismatch repair protein MutL